MRNNVFPTKGNLLSTKKSLALAKMGFELLDRKRNILVREMMQLIDQANTLHNQISDVYNQAYQALQMANITLGICEPVCNSSFISTSGNSATTLPSLPLRITVPPGKSGRAKKIF